MNNQLCKDNVICCDDNCQRCANLIYNKYVELQEENKRLKQEYEPVRHGEWIEHGNWFGHIEYECTSCNDTTFDASEMCYCPWCGAKMDGGKEQ